MLDVDRPAFLMARKAVELLLGMGRDSYRADIIEYEGGYLSCSPLAGQKIETQLEDGMCVGPADRAALCHVTMSLSCLGYKVQAYCSVSSDDTGRIHLMVVSVYMDCNYVIKRSVSVKRDGSLEPWGMPDGYTPPQP